jgi:lipopolysaccharide/colanic/teichoic acid biosynthesis glycosyltransferase
MIKRVFDLSLSLILLLLISPLWLFVHLLSLVFMGRTVYFIQPRPGLHGRVFKMVKFRTMRNVQPNEDMLGSDSQRLTPWGQFLRKSSLDEIPELFNILKGDMSLVGPRPLLVSYLDRYNDFQKQRHLVKPGLTGWAQINGRNAQTWEQRFEMDVWYVQNQSFFLDLKILLITVLRVFSRRGTNQMPEFKGNKDA